MVCPVWHGYRCALVLGLFTVAGALSGCASQSRDLVRTGRIKAQTLSTAEYRLDSPSVRVEDGTLVVAGTAHRPGSAATQPVSHQSGSSAHLRIVVLTPSGALWQEFMVALSPTQRAADAELGYSLRYSEPPPEGALMVVGVLDQNHEMIGSGGGGGGGPVDATGNTGPGLVGYGAPGGPVYNQASVVQQSLSQRAFTTQTLGANRAVGRSSPGYFGTSGRR